MKRVSQIIIIVAILAFIPVNLVKAELQCPGDWVKKMINSVEVCVAQEQGQSQQQSQSNNQQQTVSQNVSATGGSSSSSSSSSSNVSVVTNNSVPQVIAQAPVTIRELPRTGLPLAALALGGLLPAGLGIKKFVKAKKLSDSANSIWLEKELKS